MSKTITIRLTEWELQELEKTLKITKQNRSRFIVMAMLEKIQKIKGE